jgi:hypothetical protein
MNADEQNRGVATATDGAGVARPSRQPRTGGQGDEQAQAGDGTDD